MGKMRKQTTNDFVNEAFLFTAFHQVGQKSRYLLNKLFDQLDLGVCIMLTGQRPVIWGYVRSMCLRQAFSAKWLAGHVSKHYVLTVAKLKRIDQGAFCHLKRRLFLDGERSWLCFKM